MKRLSLIALLMLSLTPVLLLAQAVSMTQNSGDQTSGRYHNIS